MAARLARIFDSLWCGNGRQAVARASKPAASLPPVNFSWGLLSACLGMAITLALPAADPVTHASPTRPDAALQPGLTNAPLPATVPILKTNAVPVRPALKINESLRLSPLPFATPNVLRKEAASRGQDSLLVWQIKLDVARQERLKKQFEPAATHLIAILEGQAPEESQRQALIELALIALDENKLAKAQQIFAQYLARWPEDPSIPDILLRQGLVYRQMGLNNLALSKFYSVMTRALSLKTDRLDYYQQVVLQAQIEIAETHYQQGKYLDAVESFKRLLELDAPILRAGPIQFKLIRSLASLGRSEEVVAQSQDFLHRFPGAEEAPEVRFCLAGALKRLGRNGDSLQQVLLLLQDQQGLARTQPERLAYWQQRTGNEIANQLFQEGDFVKALEIYAHIAALNPSAAWQIPAWYQIGLVYERLHQSAKAVESYDQILKREKELGPQSSPGLKAVVDMARWRQQFLTWQVKTETASDQLHQSIASDSNESPIPLQFGARN